MGSDDSNSHVAPVPCRTEGLCVRRSRNLHYLCYSIAWCNYRLSSVVRRETTVQRLLILSWHYLPDCDARFHPYDPTQPHILMKGALEGFHFRSLNPLHQINSHLERLMHTGQWMQHPFLTSAPLWLNGSPLPSTQPNSSNQSEICLRPETATARCPTFPSLPHCVPPLLLSWFVLCFQPLMLPLVGLWMC